MISIFDAVQRRSLIFVSGICLILAVSVGTHSTYFCETRTSAEFIVDSVADFAPIRLNLSLRKYHSGCSRYHLPYNQVDTASLTGYSKAQLAIMPSTYWKYENGSLRVTFIRSAAPCNGPSCGVPKKNSIAEMPSVTELTRGSTGQSGVVIGMVTFEDLVEISDRADSDFCYISRTCSPLLRPPNALGHSA